jgi:Der1-like family
MSSHSGTPFYGENFHREQITRITIAVIIIIINIMADVHNINNQNDPSQWFKTLPIVTQAWFGATMALTLGGNFGIVDIKYMFWSWGMIRERMELWRVVTSFCYAGPFEFNTLITICKCYCAWIAFCAFVALCLPVPTGV